MTGILPESGRIRPAASLRIERFSGAAFAEKDFCFARFDFEGDAAEHFVVLESEVHILEDYDRFARSGFRHSRSGSGRQRIEGSELHAHDYKSERGKEDCR